MTKPNPREDRIFLAIWRKVAAGGTPLLTLKSESEAISVRMKLYRVIQPYRAGKIDDEQLAMAAEKFVVSITGNQLTFKEKVTAKAAEKLFAELGLSEADLLTPEEAESQERMLKMLKGED